jgi:prevent-host-death family protein
VAVQRWQLQDAKQQFSRVVEGALSEGPQVVTRNGKEVAVVLDIDEYRRLTSHGGDFKKFLESFPDVELETGRSREPAIFPEVV